MSLVRLDTRGLEMPVIMLTHLKPRNRQCTVLALFTAILVTSVYSNSLDGEFVSDDLFFIKQNEIIRELSNVPVCFTQSFWGSSSERGESYYRPIVILSYALNYAVGGYTSFGYHVTNVCVHAANAILIFAFIYLIFDNMFVAAMVSLLFGVHPIVTEAVSWISGRTDLLGSFFILAAFVGYVLIHRPSNHTGVQMGRKRIVAVLSLCAFVLALLSKETAVTLPAILILYEVLFRSAKQGKVLRILPYVIILGVYAVWREWMIGSLISGQLLFVRNPLAQAPFGTRCLTGVVLFGKYVAQLAFPVKLSFDYGFDQIPVADSLLDPRVFVSALVAALMLWLLVYGWRYHRMIAFGIGLFLVTGGLIFANAIFPYGVMFADRFMYLPLSGFVLACAGCIQCAYGRVPRRVNLRKAGTVVLTLLTGALMYRTWTRNADWHDSFTMAQRTVETSPKSATARTELGQEYFERGSFGAARAQFLEALEIYPRFDRGYVGLGEVALAEGNAQLGLQHLLKADELRPHDEATLLSLGVAYKRLGMIEQAKRIYRKTLQLNPKNSRPYNNLGNIFLQEGDLAQAAAHWKRAVEINPFNAEAAYNLAAHYERQGELERAIEYYRQFVKVAPARLADAKAKVVAWLAGQTESGQTSQ